MTRRPRDDEAPLISNTELAAGHTPATTTSFGAESGAVPRAGDPALQPRVGEVIAGKYRLEERLGMGGMGVVYRAVHVVTGKPLAVKWILRPTADERVRSRFLREARAAARIDHPNVVNVFDVGEVGPCGYLVMELLRGETLKSRLLREITPAEVIALLLPAMRGIVAVHAAGVVHRDLKPENIFLCVGPDGAAREAKVLDFGISAFTEVDAADARPTGEGLIVGTPAYMSPEQLEGAPRIDQRSDIYALGVILYEGLTGQRPFQATTFSALMAAIVAQEPVPPSQLQPSVPEAWSAIVLRAMAKRPEDRFQTVQSLIEALELCQAPQPAASRRDTRWWLVGVLLAGLAAVMGLWAWQRAARVPPPSAASQAQLQPDEPYLAGATCSECIERACSAQRAACRDDARCESFVRDAQASPGPLVANRAYLAALSQGRWALDHDDEQGAWLKPRNGLTQCVRDRCVTECQIGRKLSCVGQFEYPASYPKSSTLNLRVSSIQNAQPLADWTVKACAPGPYCDRSMAETRTDERGFASLVVDFTKIRPNSRTLAEFDGTIELSGSGDHSARVFQQTAPFLDAHYSRWMLATREHTRTIHESRNLPTLRDGFGSVDVQQQDCEYWYTWGVMFEVWRYSPEGYRRCSDCSVMYPDDAGNPDPSLKSVGKNTRSTAVAILPAGEIMIKARDAETGRLISVLPHVHVRSGYEHSVVLFPASKEQLAALGAD
jgi:hypothetical protein